MNSEKNKENKLQCYICKKTFSEDEIVKGEWVRHSIAKIIAKENPGWNDNCSICVEDLNNYRQKYIRKVLAEERGELSNLDEEVVKSLNEQELLSRNINSEFDSYLTFGEKVADKVAEFGGSWKFIISFGAIVIIWIGINVGYLFAKPFDPYPFILLNLLLSCLAAIQAPIIMMSQNRQEQKDRLRAEQDYKTNLKAELEVRHLNEKLDHSLSHQWMRLMEMQQIQMDLMEQILQLHGKKSGDKKES